jgi:hypothetical protein
MALQVDLEEGIRRAIDWARANPWYSKDPQGASRKTADEPEMGCATTQPRVVDRDVSGRVGPAGPPLVRK